MRILPRILSLFVGIFLFIAFAYSQPPASYYSAAEGKSSAALKTELGDIISAGYRSISYDALLSAYRKTDVRPDGNVWDMYSTCSFSFGNTCGNYQKVCDCYNREHSIPQSWFGKSSPMVSDIFHVYPTDGKVNGQRSNFPFGECANGTTLTGGKGKLGSSSFPGYSGTVFEPDDEYKGDFARTYFYMVCRYESRCTSWSGDVFTSSRYPGLASWCVNLFLKWHRQDPVSSKEVNRNNIIFTDYQKNRNPFIDYPELAEYIWGNKVGQDWQPSPNVIDPVEDKDEELKAYFNDEENLLKVIFDQETPIHYSLSNISGKVVQEGTMIGSGNLNTNGMMQGVYLMRLEINKRITTKKVVVR